MSTPLFPRHPVLLVDDEAGMRRILRMTLVMDGISNVAECSSTADAHTWIGLRPVSVVILDLMMPGGSGLELLYRIRQAAPRPSIIVISGLQDPETVRFCTEAGAVDYLVKPVDRSHLLSSVRKAIARWEQEAGAQQEEAGGAPRPQGSV